MKSFPKLFAVFAVFALLTTACQQLTNDVSNWWGVDNLGPSSTTNINSYVFDIAQIGETIYVAGKFRDIAPSGGSNISQPYVAAFNAGNGVWKSNWRPQVNGPVFALERSADGSKLFIGGEFTSVNGSSRRGLTALDPSSGALAGFPTVVGGGLGLVRSLVRDGSDLYVGGSFNFVARNGAATSFNSVARINQSNGVIDTQWKPVVGGGGVWGVAASQNHNRVYLAGLFTTLGGVTQRGFGVTNATNGARLSGFNHQYSDERVVSHFNHDVLVSNGNVFLGGSQHQTTVYRESNWTLRYSHITEGAPGDAGTGGDTQDLELFNGRVYVSCHCWGSVWSANYPLTLYRNGQWNDPSTSNRTGVRGLFRLDAATGARIDNGFTPNLSGIAGPWATHGDTANGCLWAGGQFTQQAGVGRKHLTRFCQ